MNNYPRMKTIDTYLWNEEWKDGIQYEKMFLCIICIPVAGLAAVWDTFCDTGKRSRPCRPILYDYKRWSDNNQLFW